MGFKKVAVWQGASHTVGFTQSSTDRDLKQLFSWLEITKQVRQQVTYVIRVIYCAVTQI